MFNPRAILIAIAIGLAGGGVCYAQTPINVGYIDKGFFDKRGLDVTLTRINLISNIPAALLSGSINVGMSTGPGFLQATEAGIDLVIPGGIARNTPGRSAASLVAGKDSGVTRAADMKPIAVVSHIAVLSYASTSPIGTPVRDCRECSRAIR